MKYRLSEIYKGCKKGGSPSLKKDWKVIYYKDGVRKSSRGGINYEKTIKGREKEAADLKDEIDAMLIKHYSGKGPSDALPAQEAMEWALDKCKKHWAPDSVKEYTTPLKFFYQVLEERGMLDQDIKLIDTPMMMDIVDRMCQIRGVGAYMYIKYKTNIGRIMETLKDYRKIPYNPCSYKPPVRKPKPKAKKLLTKKQSIAVYNQIRNSDFPYYINYLAVLNMTGIRPKEIYSLLIKNIDLKSKVIFVPADDTKDSEDRMVPIPKVLIPYLKELNLDEYPDDYYVFGYNFLPEQRVMPVKRDVSTKLWKRLIKDPVKDGGLGIESNQYWLKAQGMRDAREAGVSAEAVQLSRGHANYDESLGYIGLNRPSNVKELENKTPDPWKDKQSKKPRLRGLSE